MAEYNETDYSGYEEEVTLPPQINPWLSDETPDHDLTPGEAARVWGWNLDSLKDLAKRLMSGKGSASEYGGLASILAGLYSANKSSGPTILNPGYQGGIPKYTATRQMLTAPPAGRRPGSGGINYGGDVTYTRTGQNLSAENAGISTPVSQPLGGTPTLTQPSGYDLPSLLALIQQLQGAGLGGPGRPSAPSPTSGTSTSGTPAPSTTVVDRPPALTQATTPLARVAGGQSGLNLYEPGYDKPFGSTSGLNLYEPGYEKRFGVTPPGSFVVGGDDRLTPEERKAMYERDVQSTALGGARYLQDLINYQPTGTSSFGDLYARALADPSLIGRRSDESMEEALLRLKYNIMQAETRQAGREAAREQVDTNIANWNIPFIISGLPYGTPGVDPYNGASYGPALENMRRIMAQNPQFKDLKSVISSITGTPFSTTEYKFPAPPGGISDETDEPRLNLQEIPQVTFPAPPDRIIEDDFDMRRRLQEARDTAPTAPVPEPHLATAPKDWFADHDDFVDLSRIQQEIRKTAPTAPVPEPHLATAPKDWFADHDDFVDLSRMLQEIRKTAPTAPVPVAPTPPGTGGPGASQQPMHTAQPQGRPLLAAPQQKFEMFPPGESDYRIEAAKGGLLPNGFVVPADVVSHLGNGSSEAGLKVLARQFGARPIRGSGDGMSDSIPTTIGGKQPARVANEEAFIPPSVVKRLGNGDTNRGAKKLYAMMDRIRKARTGTTEQGKEINPEKFMPGGKVSGYQTGGAITTNPSAGLTSSSLASWVGPYVTDMLGKGQALSEAPYQAYTGPLTAGPSALEQQAFGAASTFQPSAAIGQAAQTAGGIAAAAQGMGYTPATFGNQFTAPGAYQTGTFGTDTFGTQQAQQYMNPYLQSALDPQMKEMQRQADIQRAADAARLTKAGAYGGSRQAIMEAEGRRNLLGKQAEVLGQGYATAYDKAQQAFAQDQARRLEAQRATEASRQFGAGQGLTSAQLAAQYGLAGQQAAEASRQFGSELGLRGLQTGLQAAQAQGNLGGLQTQYGLEGIKQLADLGRTQRGIEAEGIAADKAQFEEARLNPFKMLQFQQSLLSGLPLASQSLYQPGQSNLQQFATGATTVQKLLQSLGIIK